MQERQAERTSSSITELIKRTKCDQKTCSNFDHNCLVLPGQKHFILSANDFCKWDKAIGAGKASLDLPPLSEALLLQAGNLRLQLRAITQLPSMSAFLRLIHSPSALEDILSNILAYLDILMSIHHLPWPLRLRHLFIEANECEGSRCIGHFVRFEQTFVSRSRKVLEEKVVII